MPFYYVNGSTEFDIEELPLDRWIEIQKVTGRQWHECLSRELLGDAAVARAVLDACAAETGTVLPSPLTLRRMVELVVWRDGENTPVQYNEGVPDPKVPGTGPATI